MRTIANFKSDLIRKLHGTSLSKVQSVNDTIAEAGRNVLTRLDPQETIRITNIENALFDDVTSYTTPSDLKQDKIVDIRPQVGREYGDQYTKRMIADFGRSAGNHDFNVLYKNGTKFLQLKEDVKGTKTVISEVNSTSGWSAGDAASNLTLDSLNYITGSKSINFDIGTTPATGYVENSTLPAVDLSETTVANSGFVWVFLPDATKVTSITGRIGSSSSNYLSQTVTTTHDTQAFFSGWNLLRFELGEATETGTVDYSSITYFRLTIAHNGTGDTDYRLDSITVGVGEIYEMVYYSDAIFKGTDGSYKSVPTLDTDTIQLETDAYNIMLYECAYILSQEIQGENGAFDESFFDKTLNGDSRKPGLYRRYHMMYPSQNKKARSQYYQMPRGTYR